MNALIGMLILSVWTLGQTAEDIALRVERKLHSFETFQAEFEQFYYSSTISVPLHERGKLYFKNPGMMKWEYQDPEEKVFLIKDGIFWDYNKEEEQLIKYSIAEEGENTEIIALLSGQMKLLDTYDVDYSPFPTENEYSKQIKLTPKDEEFADSFLLLEIDEKNWLILKIISFDWTGNKTEFHFKKFKTNISLATDTFDIKIPPGTEIIENREKGRQ
ncbi:MAG: outer membrane lipoprotein carrier protein LolA [Candidatus Aminicenantes bacterium]|nr:outer membrane lipoprotein carrier protein LolA [Candidatus Aminicenantes bacterium]